MPAIPGAPISFLIATTFGQSSTSRPISRGENVLGCRRPKFHRWMANTNIPSDVDPASVV
jgi:hypothetical protein